jgi:hypothetical protein
VVPNPILAFVLNQEYRQRLVAVAQRERLIAELGAPRPGRPSIRRAIAAARRQAINWVVTRGNAGNGSRPRCASPAP